MTQNQTDLAIDNLQQAFRFYPRFRDIIKTDPDFAVIQNDDRLQQLIQTTSG